MRALTFASRVRKELFRDLLSLLFALALPVVLIAMMSVMYRNVPDMATGATHFAPEQFAPGISILSLSFISLFTGMLVANDRETAFLSRLFSSPMTAGDFLIGYSLPLLAAAVVQSAVCFTATTFFGLPVTGGFFAAILVLVPVGVLFTGIGILLGSLLNNKQVGGVGSILVQVATLLGGTWFPLSLIGGVVETIAYCLPFAHAVDMARAALAGNYAEILPHMLWVLGYSFAVYIVAAWIFRKKMRG